MNSNELRALADTVNSIYAETYTQREAIERVVAYLRAQADAEPVAAGWKWVPVEPTQAMNNAGLSAVNQYGKRSVWETYAAMLAAAPAAPQAEPKEENNVWKQIIPDNVPQAEPKREPLSDESPKVEWLSTDDAETQLALAIRDAVKVAPSADDKSLLYALNRRGIWLAWIGGSDAE